MATNEAENSLKKTKVKKREATSGSFPKGKSGNPGGRPKKTDEQRAAEAKAADAKMMIESALPEMTEKMLKLFREPDTPPNIKYKIWELSIERIYGKAFQEVMLEADDDKTTGVIIMPARATEGGD